MSYNFPTEIQTLVDERMATGVYSTENELLMCALRLLPDYEEGIRDIRKGMEDEASGRLRSVQEADAQLRDKLGFKK